MADKNTIVDLVKRIHKLETEQELTRKAQEALKESEERFRLISETIHFGVFETDNSGSCLYTNTRYQEILGINLVESLTTHWLDYVVDEDRDWVVAQWLMLARNWLLARLASSASSLAFFSSCSFFLRLVMFSMVPV